MTLAGKRPLRGAVAALAAGAAVLLAGCGGSGTNPPAVPRLTQSAAAAGHATGGSRAAALHAAAQCIRQHGVPSYQDPVLTPAGQIYTDSRSLDDVSPAVLAAVHQACRTLMTAAALIPDEESLAPPQLIRAGVRSAECMRAHGLPNVTDPAARSSFTPGHGFGYNAGEIPGGGKANPVYQAAAHACRPLLDAEIRASTLTSLSNDG